MSNNISNDKITISPQTKRFFDMIKDDKFWTWAIGYYFYGDAWKIISDLTDCVGMDNEEIKKIIMWVNNFILLLEDKNIKNIEDLIKNLNILKKKCGFNTIYKLKEDVIKICNKKKIVK